MSLGKKYKLQVAQPNASNRKLRYFRVVWGLRLYVILMLLTVLAYASVLIPPNVFWPAGFVSFSIPIWIILHLLALVYWLLVRPVYAIASVVILAMGFPYIRATYQQRTQTPQKGDLKVISMNVETFRGYGRHTADKILAAHSMLKYLSYSDADILCLQEFYEMPKSYTYNTIERLKKKGFIYHHYSKITGINCECSVGMIIFSKLPIVKKKIIYKEGASNNQIIAIDVKTSCGLLRIYNVHLESIRLKSEELKQQQTGTQLQNNLKKITYKLRGGFVKRNQQLATLLADIEQCKHPVLITGDFNEIPYSYLYNRLNAQFQNSFEKKGNGFGISFHGLIPFLRIDNHFADKRLQVTSFTTDVAMKTSDHYPLIGTYRFLPEHCKY